MRNLKRALSLTLASVMLLGMMVVGSSAAGYPDVDAEDNVEAIEVVQAVGIMVGDENGNFNPDNQVTRVQMAVIMANLLDLNTYLPGNHPFNDVPSWAEASVSACYTRGVISGYGDGRFGTDDPVTAVQAASMLMRALGYFQFPNDVADGFELATIRQAGKIDLFSNVGTSSANDYLTRNQVAQLVLNALKSGTVEPDSNALSIITPDGYTVAQGQTNYVYVVGRDVAIANAINTTRADSGHGSDGLTGPILDLGEKRYNGKLKLDANTTDDFGRPARYWEYDGKEVGTYAKKELLVQEYVGDVTGKDLYDLLSATTIADYGFNLAIDGVTDKTIDSNIFVAGDMNKNNKAKLGGTGTGVLTQVYVDTSSDSVRKGQIYIAIINTYLAIASKDYDEKTEEIPVTIYAVKKNTSSGDFVKSRVDNSEDKVTSVKIAAEDLPIVQNVKKDDALLVTLADGVVQTAVPAEVLAGVQISAFKVGSNVTVDGTKYDFTTTAEFKYGDLDVYTGNSGTINLKDLTYNIYLDAYGNLIGVEEVESVKNYVFITGVDTNSSMITNKTADMNALFLDGTSAVIKVNTSKSSSGLITNNALLNTWCTYTVANDGVYTLTQVPDTTGTGNDVNIPRPGVAGAANPGKLAQYHESFSPDDKTIDKKNITLSGRDGAGSYSSVYGNANTVYLTAELGTIKANGTTYGIIKGVDSVVTGVENTSLTAWKTGGASPDTGAYAQYKNNKPTGAYYAEGVYTLYNEKGIIIAAVVVGEDNGASRNLVYAHTSTLEKEAYDSNSNSSRSNDGQWTWTRLVVQNGKEIELTEVGDSSSYLEKMVQYRWYQVKLNSNGEVIGAYRMPGDTVSDLETASLNVYGTATGQVVKDAEIVTNPDDLGDAIKNGKNTMLFYSTNINDQLNLDVNTLYVKTSTKSGFLVDEDVEIVLQQWEKNTKKTYIETYHGRDALEGVIDAINERHNGRNYTYQVSAILEGGIATSVLIWDGFNDYSGGTGNNTGLPTDSVSWENVVYADEIGSTTNLRKLYDQYNTNVLVVDNEYETFNRSITIPEGKTLAFTGNVGSDVTVGRNATLLVDGTYTVKGNIPATATVRANDIKVDSNVTFSGTVTADEDLIVKGGTTLTIASGSTVTVGRSVIRDDNSGTGWIYLRGTLYVNNKEIVAENGNAIGPNVGIVVASTNSLHILGGDKVKVKGIIIRGDGTNNGRINAPGVVFEGTFIDKNKATSEVLANIGTLKGTVVLNKNTVIEGVEVFKPTNLAAAKGATIKFTSSAVKTESINFTDKGGAPITSIAGKTIVIGGTVGADGSGNIPSVTIKVDSNSGNIDVDATTIAPSADPVGVQSGTVGSTNSDAVTAPVLPSETNVPTEVEEATTKALSMNSTVWFVYDRETWEAAYKDLGACAVLGLKTTVSDGTETETPGIYATQWSEVSSNAKGQFPWLIVEIKNPDKIAIDTKYTVTKDGQSSSLFADTTEVSYAAGKNHYLRSWTMWTEAQHPDKLAQNKTALVGTYNISAQWTTQGGTVYQTLDAATETFTTADYEAWQVAQEKNVKIVNDTTGAITYGKLSEAVSSGNSIYLIDDVTTSSVLTFSKSTNLYLNGHAITSTSGVSGGMIAIAGGETLNIVGTGASGEKIDGGAQRAIAVGDGSTLKLNKVTVTNSAKGTIFFGSSTHNNAATIEIVNSVVKHTGTTYAIGDNGSNSKANRLTVTNSEIVGGIYLPSSGATVTTVKGGSVTGGIGIGIKAGTLILDGCTVTGTKDWAVVEPHNSGINENGSAVEVETNSNYAGEINITVRNGAKLVSDKGYAISEVAGERQDASNLKSLTVDETCTLQGQLGKLMLSSKTYDWNPMTIVGTADGIPGKVIAQGENGTFTVTTKVVEEPGQGQTPAPTVADDEG